MKNSIRLLAALSFAAFATLATLAALALLAAPRSARADARPLPEWSTTVHNDMLDAAFPELAESDWLCLIQMKRGSRFADSAQFQSGEYAYMHAMRKRGQTPEEAAQLLWRFVDDKYAEAHADLSAGLQDAACFARGMALHPVMDSTSPAHRGFEQWDPVGWSDLLSPRVFAGKLGEMARHGDFQKYLDRLVALPFNVSDEDSNVIDDHPEYLEITSKLMRSIDTIEMLPTR